jgi:hypothetical protein
MNNYPADLELRKRVAEALGYDTDIGYSDSVVTLSGGDIKIPQGEIFCTQICPEYERSFDAILPLVRGLWKDSNNIAPLIHAIDDICPFKHPELDMEWIIYEATPADYCRAYLAAKGEENG